MQRSFYDRYGWAIIAALVVLAPLVYRGADRAFERANNNVAEWLPREFEETRTYENFHRAFGTDQFALVSWEGCTLDDPRLLDFARRLRGLATDETHAGLFREVVLAPEIIDSLTDRPFELTRSQALARLRGSLVGPDDQTTWAVVTLGPAGNRSRMRARQVLEETAVEGAGVPAADLRLGGDAMGSAALDIESKRAMDQWLWLASLVALLVAWRCLRSVPLVLMVLVVAAYAAILAAAVVAWSGNGMNLVLVVMPVLIYVLTLSASVHLSNYYRDAVRHTGLSGAPLKAVNAGWLPCALSSATSALGFASLAVSHVEPVRKFGIYSAIGILLGLCVQFIALPAMLEKWPVASVAAGAAGRPTRGHRFVESLAAFVISRHRLVVALILPALLLVGLGVSRIETSVRFVRFFSPDSRWVQDTRWLQERVGPMIPVEVVLAMPADAPPDTLQRIELVDGVERALAQMEQIGGTLSAATFAPLLPEKGATWLERSVLARRLASHREEFVKNRFLASDGDRQLWRISARVNSFSDVDYDVLLGEVSRRVDAHLAQNAPRDLPVEATSTGIVPLLYVAQRELLNGLLKSFALAFVMVALVMIVLLRSIPAGIISMLPNAFPAVVTFGVMGWSGRPVDVGSMMTASVALGIAVDDTLHFLTWFRRAIHAGQTQNEAIREAYHRCAAAMTQTTLIAGLGLLMFAFSGFQPIAQFGLLMFVLLVAALVGDLLLLPALLAGAAGRRFRPSR